VQLMKHQLSQLFLNSNFYLQAIPNNPQLSFLLQFL
jgi:hypothetical protein